MNGLIEGKKYVLSTPVDTVITDVKYNIPLGAVKAGQQFVFQAVSDAVTVADGCTIRPFEKSGAASVGVVGGSGDGGSSGGSSNSPVGVGYLEFDDETGEVIAADYSGLQVFPAVLKFGTYGSLFNYKGDWTSDIPYLVDGNSFFSHESNLISFTGDLSSLTSGSNMFQQCTSLTSFTSDLSSLTYGGNMFEWCSALTSFDVDMPLLTNGSCMFNYCGSLTSFNGDLSSLTNGYWMFAQCPNLTSFTSDLSSLTNGENMFGGKLDKESVLNIITCLKERNKCTTDAVLSLEINKDLKTDADILAALGLSTWSSTATIIGHGGATWTIRIGAQ